MNKITKVYVNRKMEDGQTAIVILDTSEVEGNRCFAKKLFIPANSPVTTREYITYLIAKDLKDIENETNQGLNLDTTYNFIIPDVLAGVNIPATRLFYMNTKTNKKGQPLTNNFVSYVNSIHFSLQRLNNRAKLMTTRFAIPHEYNGKILGSKYNAQLIEEAWNLMDSIVPKREMTFGFREE